MRPRNHPGKVISGGQTGVDRAALDAARNAGLPYGGWCPKGGRAEDMGRSPGVLTRYPDLKETPAAGVQQRTEWNVRDSDGTLILNGLQGSAPPGTDYTKVKAVEYGRPFRIVDPFSMSAAEEILEFIAGLPANGTLNVAGPRESQCPGIHEVVRTLLEAVFATAGSRKPAPTGRAARPGRGSG